MKERLPLITQYRPKTFEQFKGNESLKKGLKAQLSNSKGRPHSYLITGPTGSGKTTLARIIAKELGCYDEEFHEFNTANQRGIDTIRDIIDKAAYEPILGFIKVYLFDECFSGDTQVLIDYDKAIAIKDIVDGDVNEVLSYDLKNKQILRKKIVRKIKIFRKSGSTGISVKINYGGNIYVLPTTLSHKFFVESKGEVEAKDLLPGDKLISFQGKFEKGSFCEECGDWVSSKKSCYHIIRHVNENRKGVCKYCGKEFEYIRMHEYLIHEISQEEKNKRNNNISSGFLKFLETELGKSFKQKNSESKKGENNPLFKNGGIGLTNLKKSLKKRWKELSEEEKQIIITRFMNAPKYNGFPNNPEKVIIDMKIENERKKLEFTGDGSFWIKLKNKDGSFRSKNPDFVVRLYNEDGSIERVLKYIEVMDLDYWHKNDWEEIKRCYERSGKEILILDSKEILKNPLIAKSKIESFINNDLAFVVDVKNYKIVKSNEGWLYNLEIEGTNNYFACAKQVPKLKYKTILLNSKNQFMKTPISVKTKRLCITKKLKRSKLLPILVSNCHQITGEAAQALLKFLEDPPPHVYSVLCTTDPEKLLTTIKGRCSIWEVNLLRKAEIVELLNWVVLEEKKSNLEIDVPIELIDEIAKKSEGCCRVALGLLEQIINVPDVETKVNIVVYWKSYEETVESLVKMIINRTSWSEFGKVLENFDKNLVEKTRLGILGYFSKVLLNGRTPDDRQRAAKVMDIFNQPFYNSPLPSLILACYKSREI